MRSLIVLGTLALATPVWSAAPTATTKQDYVTNVEKSLTQWDERIGELKGATSRRARNVTAVLESLQRETQADLNQLDQIESEDWQNAKARIEARMRRMEKEYRYVYAE